MKSNYNIIKDFLEKHCGKDCLEARELDTFVKAKEKFLQTDDSNDLLDMQMTYVNIYESLKIMCYSYHYMDETKFASFVEILKQM